jgi:hypothetical protein
VRYKAGDRVVVVAARRFFLFGPFHRCGVPRHGFPRGQARGAGVIVEIIEPSTSHGIANVGGYRVRLDDGTLHYYAEDEIRPA